MPDRMQKACQPDLWGPFCDVAGGPLPSPMRHACGGGRASIDSWAPSQGMTDCSVGLFRLGVGPQFKMAGVSVQDIPAENQDNLEG